MKRGKLKKRKKKKKEYLEKSHPKKRQTNKQKGIWNKKSFIHRRRIFILLPPKVEPTTTPMESDGVEAKDNWEIFRIERRRMIIP